MSVNPVNAWDSRLLAVSEATLGTTPAPANAAAYAAQALEFISASLGPAEVGQTRAKKDRNLGRGMTSAFVEGRVAPIAWQVQLSVKSRAAIDAVSREAVLYAAAGLKRTVNAGTSYVLAPSATPIESGDFASASLTRLMGASPATYEAEILRGCVANSLKWEGGDKELLLTAGGSGVGKYTQGGLDSITVLIGATSLACSAEESYRLTPGYYLCESEVILLSGITPGVGVATMTRGQLGTAAAAHTAKPLQPYVPTGIVYGGSPIAEPNATVTIGGISIRAMSWHFDLNTGMDLLPGETGSKYVQGAKYGRYDAKLGMRLVLSGDQVSLLGKVTARPNVAVVISQGVGVGGIFTLSCPYAEVEPFVPPDTANDVAIVDVSFRLRDDTAGNNLFQISLT